MGVDTGLMPRSWAMFSSDRAYRYALFREWGEESKLVVIGLNPSTADEYQDDPTIRRCIGYAKAWGHGGLVMLNLFAFRATQPGDMKGDRWHHMGLCVTCGGKKEQPEPYHCEKCYALIFPFIFDYDDD